jgi:putative lipoprotein
VRGDFNLHAQAVIGVAVGGFISVSASAAIAQSIQGTAMYRERIALQPAAVFEAVLEDVTRADAPAETIARTRMASPGNPPIAFTIAYDPSKIAPDHRYAVRARILVDDKPLFVTDTTPPVITRGGPVSVSLMLRRVGTGQTSPATSGSRPLEGTYWKAIELAGKSTPTQDPKREAHLQFQGGRVSGSDGCNRLTGTYQLNGDRVAFGQIAGTQMACVNPGGTEGPFRDALKSATKLTVAGDRLELSDAAGTRLAVFAAGSQASSPSPSPTLAGTSWQLVKFQGSDDMTRTPDDRSKYNIEFGSGGRLTARVDCNRGHGTWKSSGSNQIAFRPLALTRAKCPAGSLHDQIVKQWGNIRSYVVRDGHLFLSLMADVGIYEFEPIGGKTP